MALESNLKSIPVDWKILIWVDWYYNTANICINNILLISVSRFNLNTNETYIKKMHTILKWYNSDFFTRFFWIFKKLLDQNLNGMKIKSKVWSASKRYEITFNIKSKMV